MNEQSPATDLAKLRRLRNTNSILHLFAEVRINDHWTHVYRVRKLADRVIPETRICNDLGCLIDHEAGQEMPPETRLPFRN